MTPPSRPWTGLLIAFVLVAGTLATATWRLRVAHRRGWAGFMAMPQKPAGKPERPLSTGVRLGGVIAVMPASPAERAGITVDDDVDAVNGVSTRNGQAMERIDENVHRGSVVVYTLRRHGAVRNVPLRFESPVLAPLLLAMLIVSLVVALVFLGIGGFIYWRDPVDRRAVVFFTMAIVAAVYFISSAAAYVESRGYRGVGPPETIGMLPQIAIYLVTLFLFAPLLLHLALIFPKPRPIIVDRPDTLRWIYGPPIVSLAATAAGGAAGWALTAHLRWLAYALCAAGAVVVLAAGVRLAMGVRQERGRAFRRQPVATLIAAIGLFLGACTLASHFIQSFAGGVIVGIVASTLVVGAFLIYPVATVIALYRTYRESGVEEKRQVKWPLWAMVMVLGVRLLCGGLVAFSAFSEAFQGRTTVTAPMEVLEIAPRLLYVLIPLAFAFAIVKYRLMNIDLIIRRTVTYALLSVVVFLAYGVLVAGVGTLLVKFAGVQNQAMVIASTIVVALVAVPLRNTLQHVVDRNVFRERVSHPLALRTLAGAVSGGAGREELLRLLAEQMQQALQNRMVLVAMRSDQHFVAAAKVGVADEVLGSLRVPLFELTRPFEPADERLRRLGAKLIVPMRAQREAIGFIALGAKLSNDPFSAEDIEFLGAAASQVAMALETSRLRNEEVDFEQARAMQQVLLPKSLPRIDGVELSGMWHPARSVGGDYYDAIDLGGGVAGICIADVAGKGMPAALLMASLQAAVKATASADTAPARLCEKVRHVVAGNLAGGTFITFFYALLDANARTLTYCNAGHNPPMLVRAGGDVERLATGGSVFGRLFRAESYEQTTVTLAPGDRVVLFTDGVSEARRGDEDFGDERLIDVVRSNRELGVAELQEKIVEAITAFTSGNFEDDVTLVVVGARS